MKTEKESFNKKIINKIDEMPKGEVFTVVDFLQYTERNTVRVVLKRLCDKLVITPIIRGVYYKPVYSRLLKEYLPPDPIMVAKTIARANSWKIIPAGDTALNMLGISTQVPAIWKFLSDGPYKEYNFFGVTVQFKHTALKTLSGLSETSALVIQALRALGNNSVTDKTILILKNRLTDDEKKTVLKETANTIEWVRKIIVRVCEGV
jgi:hypothetical protein